MTLGFDEAIELGLVDLAVRTVLETSGPAGHKILRLRWLARKHPDDGALAGQEDLERRVKELFRAGEEDVDGHLERLWRTDHADIGVAQFPVATLRGAPFPGGAVLRFVVGHGEHLGELGSTLIDAVDLARRAAIQLVGELDSLPQVRWRIEPAALAKHSDGASIGLAASVAFASYATRRPISGASVFTGVLSAGGDRVGCPDPKHLPAKLEATGRRHRAATLYCPELPRDLACPTVRVREETSLAQIFRELGISRPTDRPRLEEADLTLIAIVEAGSGKIARRVVHDALQAPHWRQGLTHGIHVDLAIERLVGNAMLVASDDALGRAQAPMSDLGRLENAHRALAWVLDTKPKLDPHGVGRMAHLGLARDWPAARSALVSVLARFSTNDRPARRLLLAAFRRLRADSPSSEQDEIETLIDVLLDAASVGARLVGLALRCDAAPSPIRELADGCTAAEDDVDDLLWTQAIAESVLHILAGHSLVVDAPKSAVRAALVDRPSIGTLVEAARATPLGNAVPKELANSWNDTLRHTGAWAELATKTDSHVAVQAVVASTARLVRVFMGQMAINVTDTGVTTTVAGTTAKLEGLTLRTRGAEGVQGVAFFRGVYDGEARWFDFGGGAPLYAAIEQLTPQNLADPKTGLSHLLGLAARATPRRCGSAAASGSPRINIMALPQPVARALAVLQKPKLLVLDRLAAVDLAFAALFRLVAFSVSTGKGLQDLLARPTKRKLVEVVLAGGGMLDVVAAPLRDPQAAAVARELVRTLEWLEHCGGTLRRHADVIAHTESLITSLIACWRARTDAMLVVRDGALTVALSGVESATGRRGPLSAEARVGWQTGSDFHQLHGGARVEVGPNGAIVVVLQRDASTYFVVEMPDRIAVSRRSI